MPDFPAQWVIAIVEDEFGPSLEIGLTYEHPNDGPIKVIGGRFWGEHGLSNHWTWEVIATGERKSGYGGPWPKWHAVEEHFEE